MLNLNKDRKFLPFAAVVTALLWTFTIGCTGFFVNPTLVSLAVSPNTPSILQGGTQQMVATGTYNDNSQKDLTDQVSWSSDTPASATVSNTGLVTGVSPGSATISAAFGSLVSTADVTVSLANIVSITVTPQSSSINHGGTQQFTATATLTDGTMEDITDSAMWSSSNPSAGSIDSSGLFTSATSGIPPSQPSTITATSGGTTSNSATITVN